MRSSGQSAVEWLMTHAWSIIIVLCLGLALSYLGIFDTRATPRFEGLQASSLQPIPDHVVMYSDGMMVLTVVNTKPYKIQFEWVDISPTADAEDVIRTNINTVIASGELMSFEVDATNIYPETEASLLAIQKKEGSSPNVDFTLCLHESFTAGGTSNEHTVCGKGKRIPVVAKDEAVECPPCALTATCLCGTTTDCPLDCQVCVGGLCNDWEGCAELSFETGANHICVCTEAHPEGECVMLTGIP